MYCSKLFYNMSMYDTEPIMSTTRAKHSIVQLSMQDLPAPEYSHTSASCCSVAPGQEVLYLGTIRGGPRYGSRGIVKGTLRHKAVVDMGRSGTWRIPYYFLAVPQAA